MPQFMASLLYIVNASLGYIEKSRGGGVDIKVTVEGPKITKTDGSKLHKTLDQNWRLNN